MTNGADHERIWLQPKCCAGEYEGRQWCQDNVFDDGECEGGAKATEYVRADLAATRTPSPSSDIEELVAYLRNEGRARNRPNLNTLPHKLEQAADTLLAIQRERDALRAVVTKCADKFDHYEQLHRLKCTSEGDEKADRNRELADMCRAALTATG
jgi:succinate dehydrogenase/fumarate reductase flavoprotein subunit